MLVDPARAAGSWEYGGRKWYFCSTHCLEKFRADPAKYLGETPAISAMPVPEKPPDAGAIYTCPMHPEVVKNGPGSCPICGMALEPRTPTLDDVENPELRDMSRRFWISVILTAPILTGSMGEMMAPAAAHWFSSSLWIWLQLALATPVVLWAGWPFFERGWASIVHRSPNMFTLIAMGTGTAYLYSLVATIAPSLFPSSFRGHGGTLAVYFEPPAENTTLL